PAATPRFSLSLHDALPILPRVARLLPIPRRYAAKGVERYGFHGLSYAYLMEELGRVDPAAAKGRVILAHLGNGASLAAVRHGKRDRKSTRLNSSHLGISYA